MDTLCGSTFRPSPLYADTGEICCILSTYTDITKRIQAEEALRQSEKIYRQMFETNMSVKILIEENIGCIIDVNRSYCSFYGYSKEQMRDLTIMDIHILPPTEVAAEMERARTEHRLYFNFRHRLASGDIRDVEVYSGPVDIDERPLLYSIVHDVTERRRAEAELLASQDNLRRARDEAENANRAKDEFLSRMSHELRTPLNAIVGFANLLPMEELDPDTRDSIDRITKAGRHLLTLINEVLDFTRIGIGNISLSIEDVNVHLVISTTVEMLATVAAQYHVRLQNRVTSRHLVVRADQQRLTQVMINLVSNAVKYNRPDGTVTISVFPLDAHTRTLGDSVPAWLRISVADTGYGIPERLRERLFVPFDCLGAEHSGVEGAGLGLSLSRSLVIGMGGRIGFESVVGESATFYVDLPLSASSRGATPPSLTAQGQTRDTEPDDISILYIEDNPGNVQLISRLFARKPGVRLQTTIQGRIGLDLIRGNPPDLVLLDLHLPDMPGEDVLCHIRRNHHYDEMPVIILTADARPRLFEHLLTMGATACQPKPFDIPDFLATVDHVLAARGATALGERNVISH